jgi:uncharacterized protein with beta-barrel porin domain
MKKDKNQKLTPGLVDSIKKFANKSAKVSSVAALAAVSTFSAADAGNVVITQDGSITENGTNTATTLAVANGGGDALVTASGATAITATLDANAATTVASLISTSTGTGVLTLNVISTTTAGQDFTITGALTVGASTDTDDTAVINVTTGDLIIGGAVNETAATNVIDINIAASRSLKLSGNVDIEGDIDGATAGAGILILGHASTIDIKESIGATASLASIVITDNLGVIFDKDISATTLTATGTAIVAGNVIANIGLGDDIFSHLVATSNKTITGTVSETSAVSGSDMLFHNVADGAVIKSTITGTVAIDGADVGTTAKAGSLVLNSNATITDLDIIGGNVTAEASQVEIKGNLISSTGVVFDKNTGGAKLLASGTTAQTVTGTLAGIGAGEGTLQVTNTHASGVTFASAVGGTTLLLADIDTVATFNGALGAATINNSGTMIVTGAGVATAVVSSGTSTFSSTLISATVTASGGTATFNGKVTASTGLIVSGASTVVNLSGAASDMGELDITLGTVKSNIKAHDIGKLDLNSGAIEIKKTIVNGDVVFATSAQDLAGIGASGKIYMPVTLTSGHVLKLFDDAGINAATAAAVEVVVQDNAIIDYAATKSGQDISVTANMKSGATAGAELGLTKNEGLALIKAFDAVQGTSADEDIFYNALNTLGGLTATDDTDLAAHVAPQLDASSGSATATRAVTGSVQGIVSNRMASLRSGDAFVTGLSAGSGMSANSGFIQAFTSEVEQGNRTVGSAKVYGYDTETQGIAIGFDGMTENGSTIGLSASFSETSVDGLGVGKAKNDIDSYTVSVYADKATDSGYLEGSLTYGINENTGSRRTNTAGIDRTYKSEYDSSQISLKLTAGSPKEFGDGTYVTPYGSFTGTIIESDTYTETSSVASDSLALKIEQDTLSSMVGTAGIKVHKVTDSGTPMISLALNNEFGDTTINATNTYAGGGTAFSTSTDVEELSATLGLGYSFGNDLTSLSIGYEGEVNDAEYLSHYGSVKIVSKF